MTTLPAALSALLLIPMQCAAAQTRTDVAYVETISGRAKAIIGEVRRELEELDPIYDRTRLELPVQSVTRICHYRTHRLVTLKGPLQVIVSTAGIAVAEGRPIEGPAETCATPAISNLPGGLTLRAVPPRRIALALEPRIKVVSRKAPEATAAVLWDRTRQRAIAKLGRNVAQPKLSEGESYVLAVEVLGDGKWERVVQGNAELGSSTFIVVVE